MSDKLSEHLGHEFEELKKISSTHLTMLFWLSTSEQPFALAPDTDIRWQVLVSEGLVSEVDGQFRITEQGSQLVKKLVEVARAEKKPATAQDKMLARHKGITVARNEDALTVAQLKHLVAEWPETDANGEPCEVWIETSDGKHSNGAKEAGPLNLREEDGKNWADILITTR